MLNTIALEHTVTKQKKVEIFAQYASLKIITPKNKWCYR